MAKQKKFILQESEIPTQWYNIQADMPNKPMPPIHPVTKQPPRMCSRSISTTALPRWCAPMPSKRPSAPLLTSISRTRVPTPWVHIRSTPPCPSAIMPSRKVPPTSPPRQVQASGAQPSPMPPRSTVSTVPSIR